MFMFLLIYANQGTLGSVSYDKRYVIFLVNVTCLLLILRKPHIVHYIIPEFHKLLHMFSCECDVTVLLSFEYSIASIVIIVSR